MMGWSDVEWMMMGVVWMMRNLVYVTCLGGGCWSEVGSDRAKQGEDPLWTVWSSYSHPGSLYKKA